MPIILPAQGNRKYFLVRITSRHSRSEKSSPNSRIFRQYHWHENELFRTDLEHCRLIRQWACFQWPYWWPMSENPYLVSIVANDRSSFFLAYGSLAKADALSKLSRYISSTECMLKSLRLNRQKKTAACEDKLESHYIPLKTRERVYIPHN